MHRLVRISPFDSQARRHTSFASVFVYPDIDDTIEIDLRDEDIKMDVYRASGAGGQHVNKTSSAVRLTHIPTGIVVSCQQERSQGKNKATAMKMLRAALYQKKLEEQEAAKAKLEATKTDNSWGNQIRSYVFQPYTMVNDHRTELKVSDVQQGDGRRPRRVHPGVPQAVREQGGVSERHGAELRRGGAAREARRARGAGRARRSPIASRARTPPPRRWPRTSRRMGDDGPGGAVAGRLVALRSPGQDDLRAPRGRRAAGSSSTSGRTRWARRSTWSSCSTWTTTSA